MIVFWGIWGLTIYDGNYYYCGGIEKIMRVRKKCIIEMKKRTA